jgi:hypothetical protein
VIFEKPDRFSWYRLVTALSSGFLEGIFEKLDRFRANVCNRQSRLQNCCELGHLILEASVPARPFGTRPKSGR